MVDQDFLKQLPRRPGVYLMKDREDKVLYVGKTVNLYNRVRSYFQSSRQLSPRIAHMVEQVDRVEIIATRTDLEALALESNLIKEHRPKYNVKLRDDKQYPWIKITINETYPRVLVVRRVVRDGARYFGPYTDPGAMWETLRVIRRTFPIRKCKRSLEKGQKERPCLNWHIGRCLGPCQGVAPEAYRKVVEDICLFLSGRTKQLLKEIRQQMEQASAALDFERAARLRDQMRDIERVVEKQRVVSATGGDQDVLGYAMGQGYALVQALLVRDGKVIGREHFLVDEGLQAEAAEILAGFITQYYAERDDIPPEILLPVALEEKDTLAQWLQDRAGQSVYLRVPQRGAKRSLVRMAMENAQTLLTQEENQRRWQAEQYGAGLADLAKVLGLPGPPRRIEAFDISNIQGTEAVASMVVMEEGRPKASEYRRFRIRMVEGANDFAMLREAVGRRFRRGLAERAEGLTREGKFAVFPDLLVIDGGKGQLNAVLAVLAELGLEHIPTIGLAKQFEEIYRPGIAEPLRLPGESMALRLLQQIRDEAHRFAITYHRSLRSRRTVATRLDEIPGIGPKRKKALLRHFGSLARIRQASLEELLQVEGMTEAAARAVVEGLTEKP